MAFHSETGFAGVMAWLGAALQDALSPPPTQEQSHFVAAPGGRLAIRSLAPSLRGPRPSKRAIWRTAQSVSKCHDA